MMIRTAGGPGTVSPIDFNERKAPRLSRASWIAIGVVAMAHVGVGIALYYQRFELKPLVQDEPPVIDILFEPLPKPEPEPVKADQPPPPPNAPIHRTDNPIRSDVKPIEVAVNDDAQPSDSTTVTFDRPVTEPVPDAPPTRADPPPARVIRNPSWVRQPSADQLMRAYPAGALADGTAGTATLSCMVEANGAVSSCAVTGETPAGEGFGRAAQRLSRYFRINPRTVDGAAEGSRVTINLRFVPPGD